MTAQSDNFTKTVNNRSLSYNSRRNLNTILRNMERALTRGHGLPKRPWYKHHIYAPGFYTGYGVKTLPGVREAIEQSEFEQVQAQIDILASVINKFSSKIKEAISLFE